MLGNLGNEKSTSELGKVCVFGATGFVGSAIVNELERQGVDWIGISRSANTHPNIVEASLSDTALLHDIISEYSCVVNAMGSFKPADFESNTKHVFQTFWENIQLFSELFQKAILLSYCIFLLVERYTVKVKVLLQSKRIGLSLYLGMGKQKL